MPITSSQVSVGTTRVKVVVAQAGNQQVIVHDHDHNGNNDVFIGNSTVTTTTGLHVPKTETIQLDVPAGDDLWAIASGNSVALHVIAVRQS
jgi:hypothetical protein